MKFSGFSIITNLSMHKNHILARILIISGTHLQKSVTEDSNTVEIYKLFLSVAINILF